ncbi:Isy1-like splicing factor [Lineolata rhizophorae]|uniref:Isy1-like splicing factor n=1 Tax=Lineolata rhizophorae TaxID=578093 RepID=A0A6A6NXQ3_9PEZI|nr:Isy1-like splicing factor [Lineolata rhizophorae]
MARNSEKAQSMLYRFRAAQAADLGILDISRTRRPKLITSIDAIPVCEKWRGQVLKEISRKVSKIQDPALSDFQVRDLNDDINKLMREKHMWEVQIRNLGGPNYTRGGRMVDEEGREIPGGGKGYRYFGRARELPGVKELFEQAAQKPEEQAGPKGGELRAEMRRNVDAMYYGYLDEEDEKLLEYEKGREKELREDMIKEKKKEREQEPPVEMPWEADGGGKLPTVEEAMDDLLERRRQKLLDKLG